MMIVDLVDEFDFKDRLVALGAPVQDCENISDIASVLSDWAADDQNRVAIQALYDELQNPETTVLPEIDVVLADILK